MSKKKIKVLKKKKVKEIKNKSEVKSIKKKIEIKDIKKKGSGLKTSLENSEAELVGEKFSEVLQQSRGPVLEQIAVSGESNLGNIIPIREKNSEESLDTGSDYTQLGNLKDEDDKYKSSSINYDDLADLNKKEEERRFGETNFEFELRNKKDGEKKYQ